MTSAAFHHLPYALLRMLHAPFGRLSGHRMGAVAAFAIASAPFAHGAPDAAVLSDSGLNTPAMTQARPAQGGVSVPPLHRVLDRFAPDAFFDDRRRLTKALGDLRADLSSAIRPTPIEIDLLLDLAALHMSQRMLPEARSFLAMLPPPSAVPLGAGSAWMSPIQTGRAVALNAALDRFAGGDAPLPETWVDAPLFLALHHVAQADYAAARPLLEQAAQILARYPAALADPVVPQLLLGAIEGGAWDAARDLAERLRAADEADYNSAYRHLLGRAAQIGGDLVAAFDNHAAAAAGTDIWAQRARLALVDIGQSTGTLPPEDARALLMQMRTLWQGGALGLATLQRLADLEVAAGNDLAALAVLAEITRRHPATPEATAAQARTWSLIAAIYARGLDKEMPLAAFMAAHQAISRENRSDPAFDSYAESFADHLVASGATAFAVSEYAALQDSIDARPVLAPEPADDETDAALIQPEDAEPALAMPQPAAASVDALRDRLRLKQADALMQGGRWAEAETLLQQPLRVADLAQADRYNHLRAQLYAALGRPQDVLATHMRRPDPEYLRLVALAAFDLAEWEASRTAYEQVLSNEGANMPMGDRINLLLATHRSHDPDRLQDLLARFPDLAPHWAGLVAGLTSQPPDVMPLRDNAARERVVNADTALRQLQAAGGNQMP